MWYQKNKYATHSVDSSYVRSEIARLVMSGCAVRNDIGYVGFDEVEFYYRDGWVVKFYDDCRYFDNNHQAQEYLKRFGDNHSSCALMYVDSNGAIGTVNITQGD